MEGEGRLRFGADEVYHEALSTAMQARNPSATAATRALVFQVGEAGEPMMILAR